MKTPSFLALIALFVALPAAADPKPGARCDVDWLEKTQATMSQPGRSVSDERIEVSGDIVKLKFGHLKTCDAATWRHLATLEPINGEVVLDPKTRQPVGGLTLRWRNKAAADFWKDTAVAQHIGLVLTVSDFYAALEVRAAEVIAAGDEVIDAGKALGFADFTVSEKPLAELSKGTSGGAIGAVKPRLVTVLEKEKRTPATVAPQQLGPTMKKLVNDGPTLGDAVMRFRVAVLALQEELGHLGTTGLLLQKRVGGATPGLTDFTAGLPSKFATVKADKANAMDETKYRSALDSLVGAGGVQTFGDQGLRGEALLDSVDMGLRNLISARSAEADALFAAAKERLDGRSIAEYEVGARTAETVKDLPPDALARSVMNLISKTPHYAKLDALYENNKREQGDVWVNSKEGQAMAAARKDLQDAALSARVEEVDGRKAVVYTQGGKKMVLSTLVPSSVENSEAYRENAAANIAREILLGALDDAKYQAVVASIGGLGQPGRPLDTNIKPGAETEISNKVPPATKKIMDGAAGCDNPKDLVRNDYETYAARRRAAAAEMASANVSSRNEVEAKRLEQLAAWNLECKKKKDDAAAIKQDFFDDPSIANAARAKATAEAEAWCVASKKAIEDEAQAKIAELAAKEKEDRDPAKLLAQADADLAAGFAVKIDETLAALQKEYTTNGNSRRKKLVELTGNSGKLTGHIEDWFKLAWPHVPSQKDKLEAALADCAAKLGFKPGSDSVSYHNPENLNNVDKYCQVGEKMTAYILEQKGSRRLVEGE